jgi:hypothetical protein
MVLAGFTAGRAAGSGGPEFLAQFGATGAGAGQTTNPRGIATDPVNGHVYVSELGNRRISEFTPWGQFVKAFGWGVADGTTAALQTCTTTCFKGLNGSGAGQLGGESALGIAVDGSGNIYVVDRGNHRVQKFNSSGEFVLMFGGEVNKTTGKNVCTKVELEGGNVCGAGTTGTGQGQFGAWKIGSFIAIGPSNTVYVGDNNRIEQFNPDGTFNSEIELPGAGFVESLAVDPSGDLYVSNEQSLVPGIRRLSSSGTVLNTISEAVNGKGEAVAVLPKALATDSAGNLYEVDDQPGGTLPEVFKFNTSGEQKASFGEGEFTASTGIGTNSVGDVYVTNSTPTNSYIRAYGPLPTKLEPPPSVPPTIGAEYAASVGTTSAVVKAEINPHFFPTTYYVEYGSADCKSSSCTQQPVSPGTPLNGERDKIYPTAGIALGTLTSGTTYHYRFVAVSGSGTVFGPDRTFKTYSPGAFALPDERAFEMVSPPQKNSAEVGAPGNAGGLVDPGFSVTPLQAAVTGEAITYPSFTSFGGDAHSAPAASTYLSKRSATGWSTENITPPDREGYTRDPFRGFSADLSFGVVIQKEPVLAPGAVEGFENLYLRNNGSGKLRALTTEAPGTADPEHYCVSFAGASENFDRVIFVATGALTEGAPEAPGASLYEWSNGEPNLVSVLPKGSPAEPAPQTGFGAGGTGQGNGCEMNGSIVRNAISADGSRIFWTYVPVGEPSQLLARLNGATTIQLDEPQGGSGPGGEGKFWAASDDGSKVFFTDPNELTPGASAGGGSLGDLYEYDFDAEPGERLTDLTVDPTPGTDPPAVRGVLGASEDGSYVYFAANGVLSGEEESSQEQKAEPGKPNLYVWHAGDGVRFIGTLSATDNGSWSGVPKEQVARVTPDGRHLAFTSVANLTGFDNVDQNSGEPVSQVYLYSADGNELTCASCNSSGARPIGSSGLPVWATPYEQPRYLSDGGERLFFLSSDALALGDVNGKQDVYEFEREGVGSCSSESTAFSASSGGCLYLISSGRNSDESYFLDASSDGRDAFLSTRQSLFPADEDERYDVYDARAGGGFPPPAPPPSVCSGEACRPAQVAPSTSSPSTPGFVGEGNVKTAPRHHGRRCAKGKRKVLRHGKIHCVPRHVRRAAR